ncbi:unnamed protein product [Soboliphyme baturini]|uniref:Metalloendopeptidase n=1 Tax=Soboliphyme baturini TaxID=241478 RepID=A0A183IID5_9BILA|nr:unnamed protein product [Soboliphyme baturini]
MQTFGIGYEHQRFDNSDFIKVNLTNVKQSDRPLYKSALFLDEFEVVTPYDISSVMHFGSKENAFSAQYAVISAVNPIMQYSIGPEIRSSDRPLSSRDVSTLNRIFLCTDRCSRDLPCMHGSYPTRDCTHCVCQYGFSGRFCDKLQMANRYNVDGCGVMNGSAGYIVSPGYPEQYPRGAFCQWLVQGKSRSERVRFVINSLDLEYETVIRSDRCMDTFYVWPHGTDVLTKSLSCFPDDARAVVGRWHTTQSNWLLIELRTNPWGDAPHGGFNVSYETIDLQTKAFRKTSHNGKSESRRVCLAPAVGE